jgi:hypothetical protein
MPEQKMESSSVLPKEVRNPFPTRSEQLVLRAEGMLNLGGEERLPSEDRRDALMYLMTMRPDMNQIELASFFKVNEKTIRLDKDVIRKRLSEEITKDDISLVISDLQRGHERIMSELAKSTAKCEYGTNTFLAHLKFQAEQETRIVEVLQSLGYYPKNLGNLTKTEFVFKAHVAKGGGVNVTPIESQEELKTIEAQEAKLLPGAYESEEDLAIRAQFEADFSDTPKQLKAPDGAA